MAELAKLFVHLQFFIYSFIKIFIYLFIYETFKLFLYEGIGYDWAVTCECCASGIHIHIMKDKVWGVIGWLPAKVGASCLVIGPLGQLYYQGGDQELDVSAPCCQYPQPLAPAHVPVFPSSLPCYGLQEIPDLNIVQIKHVGFPLLHNFSIYRITGV